MLPDCEKNSLIKLINLLQRGVVYAKQWQIDPEQKVTQLTNYKEALRLEDKTVHIELNSKPGQSATFNLWLPLEER
jgi:hypothetical protein